jgi:hypothetical protein
MKSNYEVKWVKYVEIGSKTIRLIGYSDEFLSHIERQLTFVLKDSADSFDATINLWAESNLSDMAKAVTESLNPHKLRLSRLLSRNTAEEIRVQYDLNSTVYPAINIEVDRGVACAHDVESNEYYYAIRDLSAEEFIKEGHVLIQFFNKIIRDKNTAIVHGAAVGLDGEGVLFCARGQRGKSTLSVLSMMDGFEYVSDDYLVLEQDGDKLYTDPIYSIITLSPRMYNELYDKLEKSRFLSNNGRKDKYVINIANFHNQFKKRYPVKFCMFPEIVSDKEPSIVPCPKGRAITQLVQSTVLQLQDAHKHEQIEKIVNMVKDYEFYQINLCQDIQKNTDCLRDFMNNYDNRKVESFVEDRIYEDMVFDVTHILDSETNIIYYLNEFATLIYKNLQNGVDKDTLIKEIKSINGVSDDIENEFNRLVDSLLDKNILKELKVSNVELDIDLSLIEKSEYKLLFQEFLSDRTKNLVVEYKKEK